MCFTRVQYDEGWASKKGDQEFGPILRKQKNGGSIGKDMDWADLFQNLFWISEVCLSLGVRWKSN